MKLFKKNDGPHKKNLRKLECLLHFQEEKFADILIKMYNTQLKRFFLFFKNYSICMACPKGRAIRYIFSFLNKKRKDATPTSRSKNIYQRLI